MKNITNNDKENTINDFITYFKLYEIKDKHGKIERTNKYIDFLINNLLPEINGRHDMRKFYDKCEIKKKSGGNRIIYKPSKPLKVIQRHIAEKIYNQRNDILSKRSIKMSYGFERESSIYDNAKNHINKKYILNIDIKNFFDSFSDRRVYGFFNKNKYYNFSKKFSWILSQILCVNNILPQGSPASPIVANSIMDYVDCQIFKLAKRYNVYYTRYADDLTFSTNDKSFKDKKDEFILNITNLLSNNGLNVNEEKTRLMRNDERQEVTGLTVNEIVNVSKTYYKKVRAMVDHYIKEGYFYDFKGEETKIEKLFGRLLYIFYVEELKTEKKSNEKWFNYKDTNGKFLTKNEYKKTKNSYDKRLGIDSRVLSEKERTLQKLVIYYCFYNRDASCLITEGKTDIRYIRAYMKSQNFFPSKKSCRKYERIYDKLGTCIYFNDIPKQFKYVLTKGDSHKDFNGGGKLVEILHKVYNSDDYLKTVDEKIKGGRKSKINNYYKYLYNKVGVKAKHPVILLLDNEWNNNDKPLKKCIKKFDIDEEKQKELKDRFWIKIKYNFYLAIIPKENSDDKNDVDIESLLNIEYISKKYFDGKKFGDSSDEIYYNKDDLSKCLLNDKICKDKKTGISNIGKIINIFLEIYKDYEK